ncbi:MAG TPA: 23S rRNA (guanosine(2251)-2'-O)-methyltransferase RlmB [Actinomycetota bacterium]|nr:23S rRNA (guanosine(2251)-2'-O)-methyltransferase RlmB [Actinomycetota bacterium]
MTRGRSGRRRTRPVDVTIGGRRPVLEAVRAGLAREVLVARSARATAALRDLLDAASTLGVPVRTLDAREIDALVPERNQGVATRVRMPQPLVEAELARHGWDDDALVVALDGITDPHNVGAIARSAEAAGAAVLIVRTVRGAAIGPAAVRSSAGALLHLRVAAVANISRALERLKDAGFWIAGLAPEGRPDAQRPPGRLALVVGSEGEGLSRLVRESCDDLVSIPMRGRVGSLNASSAAAVALFGYASGLLLYGAPGRGPTGRIGGKAGIR